MARRSTFLREKLTPARARTGVPITFCTTMPSRIARIIGLKIDTPGSRRRAKAKPAIPEVSANPGSAEVFQQIGGFDPGYTGSAFLEETDFATRMRAAGWILMRANSA
jgi:GT2 family glycosyltransferase